MGEQQAAAAEVPAKRVPEPEGADVLRDLGLDALVAWLEQSAYGVVVTDEAHRWLYLNPAGCRMVGRPLAELRGEDYVLSFVEHERAALLGLEQDQRDGDTDFYANTVVRPDGTELGITWSGAVVRVGDRELAPAFFHPTSALGGCDPTPEVLAAAAGRAGGRLADVLGGLTQAAVDGSRATACLLVVEDAEGSLRVAASAGVPERAVEEVASAALRLDDLPAGHRLAAGGVVLLSDGRTRLARDLPLPVLTSLGWEGTAQVPVHRAGQVVGSLLVLLPPAVTGPTVTEVTLWSALSAHASAALAEERLREQAMAHASELERQRLGRDLHDSVSAALFSLHARAQVVARAVSSGNPDLAAAAAQDMEALSRQAIAELREIVTEVRSTGVVGLVDGLTELVRSTRSRDGLDAALRVDGDVPALPPGATEHLLRIAAEALHNCVKHADARSAHVRVEQQDRTLLLTVADDGRGFEPGGVSPDRHGQRTMRERAGLCGGRLAIDSAPGRGTTVVVRVPVTG